MESKECNNVATQFNLHAEYMKRKASKLIWDE